jgi:hypothetical protein
MTQKKNNKTMRYMVRLTADEGSEIAEDAHSAGMSIAGYMCERILGHPVASEMDSHIFNEVRKIGGLLKLVHTESGGAYSEKTAEVLDMLKQFVLKLVDR